MVEKPHEIEKHQPDYKVGAWELYSIEELGQWVALLSKRATHRTNLEKRKKDLYDARNYFAMMDSKLKEIENTS